MKKSKLWIAITILFAVLLTFFLGGCVTTRAKVAVIPLSGTIAGTSQQGLLTGSSISPSQVRDYLSKAKTDPLVVAVVLRIDSPGGSAAASQEIANEILDFKEETGKPVIVSMVDVAASGGYYISVYADSIVANPGTVTGSIGVISQFIYFDGLLEKLGIELETIKAGKYKDMGSRPLTDEERLIMQNITDEIYDQFIVAVAEGRGMSVANVESLATGQIYTGSQALELGLVDELGGLNEATDLAASLAGVTNLEIVEYGPRTSLLGSLLLGLKQYFPSPLSGDELLFLRMLEGWQGLPRY